MLSIFLIYVIFVVMKILQLQAEEILLPSNLDNFVTVRINTFRRNDLLKLSLSHYVTCSNVYEIQVVWSDLKNQPPTELISLSNKIMFEIHDKDSLNNRFIPKLKIKTQVFLTVDDDVIVPCSDLEFGVNVWKSNKKSLVGFSPRMSTYDADTGMSKYLRWQHTWWNGVYTIVLTKVALLSTDYLEDFKTFIPSSILNYIDEHRNCEDIAMAYTVLSKSKTPPVWVSGNLVEIGSTGISSGSSHFLIRGECLSMMKNIAGTDYLKWIPGYQKSTRFGYGVGWMLGFFDYWKLYHDEK